MSQTVTLKLPDLLARHARLEAERSHRALEDVLLGWIERLATESLIEAAIRHFALAWLALRPACSVLHV